MVSLSNHKAHKRASFDKLRMSDLMAVKYFGKALTGPGQGYRI